jgi:hypothetical protein
MNRRHFLQTSLFLAGTGLTVRNLCSQEGNVAPSTFSSNWGDGPKKHLTCYPDTEDGRHQLHQLWVLQDNQTLLSYRAHTSQKYPFFSPMAGPLTG